MSEHRQKQVTALHTIVKHTLSWLQEMTASLPMTALSSFWPPLCWRRLTEIQLHPLSESNYSSVISSLEPSCKSQNKRLNLRQDDTLLLRLSIVPSHARSSSLRQVGSPTCAFPWPLAEELWQKQHHKLCFNFLLHVIWPGHPFEDFFTPPR